MCVHQDLTIKKKYYECKGRPTKEKHFEILKAKLGDFNQYADIGGYLTGNIKDNYMLSFERDGVVYPEIVEACLCEHWIKINRYIWHLETKQIYTLGSCCIKHFNIKKQCIECNAVHNRSKYNFCNSCENIRKFKERDLKKTERELAKYGKKRVRFGKYKHLKTVYEVFVEDPEYYAWCVEKHNEFLKTESPIIPGMAESNMFFNFWKYNFLQNKI